MFKKKSRGERTPRLRPAGRNILEHIRYTLVHRTLRLCHRPGRFFGALLLGLLLGSVCGCRTFPPLPAADLSEHGWTVRQGQAVWRRARGAPEIAGELLVGTRTNGDAFVQFSKTPFPLVIARRSADKWQIQLPTQNETHAGSGKPPGSLIWFWLARALADEPLPKHWSWHVDPKGWSLANRASGESLEGYFVEGSGNPAGNRQ